MALIYSSLSDSASPPPIPLPSSSSSSSGNKISPVLLFIIVLLSVVVFISGLIHLLYRFLGKHRSSSSLAHFNGHQEMSSSGAFQRQLQHLFHLHDSGLDQAFIDALPVFLYKDLVGHHKEPFDCAVCLCEFSEQDYLRLLPLCSHAFHMDCIDRWLLSNSTCPLCRGVLFTPGVSIDNPIYDLGDSRFEDVFSSNISISVATDAKPAEDDSNILNSKRVFSVRLGKFMRANNSNAGVLGEMKDVGETSNSNLDARRCYSMGSVQYIVANSDLQVALSPSTARASGFENGGMRVVKLRGLNNNDEDVVSGKKIGSKDESFSVSKIWLWSKKDKFPGSTNSRFPSSVDVSLPRSAKDQAG